MNKREFTRLLTGSAAALALPRAVHAQPKANIAELAGYAGADRQQRLWDGAKKEGALSIYTSAQSDDMGALVVGFEKKYGLKTSTWRAGSENVLQRTVTEARGNRHTVDIVETNGPEMESIHREKLFQPVKSPNLAQLIPQALRPHGGWVGTRLNVFVQAYNTKAVKADEVPKNWEDLLNPRWKGRLGIEAEDQDWLAGMCAELGEAKGVKLFKDIVAANGMSVRKGHTLLTQLVVSGEIPFALTVYNYKVEQLKNKGAPVAWLTVGTPIARPNGVGVVRDAPNPHAAVLFYDFEISEEGQKILQTRDFVPVSTKLESPFTKGPLRFVDPAKMLDDGDKWNKLYAEIFSGKGR
jgi:iron(III) transport system substrate-binding protein